MVRIAFFFGLVGLMFGSVAAASGADGYCIVVSKAAHQDPKWKPVVDALVAKHQGKVLTYEKSVDEALDGLRRELPKYVCFTAKPEEASRSFVFSVNRLMRRINSDPYTDALWGILTGYDADGALRIAREKDPLVIRRTVAGTEIDLRMCEEGVWYCELNRGKSVRKQPGGKPESQTCPDDTTKTLVDSLNVFRPQLFITSGHATERDWQIGFRYRNGYFRSKAGELFGQDTQGVKFPVHSDNPKVYLAVGNCLMGHIDGPDAMALAFLNRAGVCQLVGYTVPTWYGYAGWGMLDYFVEQPGRYTLAEAFFANQQALVHRLETYFPDMVSPGKAQDASKRELSAAARSARLTRQDAQGLLYDRDSLAFYGDPAWSVRMASGPLQWEQSLVRKDGGEYEFRIRPKAGAESFEPVNRNGSQRGHRPFVEMLPQRIRPESVRIVEGAELKPIVTERFLLIPRPDRCDPAQEYRVIFRATPAGV